MWASRAPAPGVNLEKAQDWQPPAMTQLLPVPQQPLLPSGKKSCLLHLGEEDRESNINSNSWLVAPIHISASTPARGTSIQIGEKSAQIRFQCSQESSHFHTVDLPPNHSACVANYSPTQSSSTRYKSSFFLAFLQ